MSEKRRSLFKFDTIRNTVNRLLPNSHIRLLNSGVETQIRYRRLHFFRPNSAGVNDVPRKTFLDKAYRLKDNEETEAFYQQWAESYDEELEGQGYAQPRRCADALTAALPDRDAPIIDLGCGTGLAGLALSQAGYTCIDGCDFSSEMLDRAGKRGIYRRLFTANLNKPPLDAQTAGYQAALAVGVFSYGHVSPSALEEILRVLKPGGTLIIGVNGHFYEEGSLTAKVDELTEEGRLVVRSWEHGKHIPGADVDGWVLTSFKTGNAA